MNYFLWNISLLVILLIFNVICEDCVQEGYCKCTRKSDGASIDLNGINNVPLVFSDTDGFSWLYNPCSPMSCDPSLGLVSALCKLTLTTDMGTVNSATFMNVGSDMIVKYTSANRQYISEVKLSCDPIQDGLMSFVKKNGDNSVSLTLISKYACLPDNTANELSVGDILLIVFFIGLLVYFVAGALLLKFVWHTETGIDLIPHRLFWMDLPFLFADGVKFTLYKTVWKNKEPPSYTEI